MRGRRLSRRFRGSDSATRCVAPPERTGRARLSVERYAVLAFNSEERSDEESLVQRAPEERAAQIARRAVNLLLLTMLTLGEAVRWWPVSSECQRLKTNRREARLPSLPPVRSGGFRGPTFSTRWRKTASRGWCWLLLQKHRGNITNP
jgi:hypothetical protein